MMDTYLISVKPNWADRFFSIASPKTVELRKGSFGKSLSADDRLLIYATLPVGKIIGEVRVRDRSQLPIDRLRGETENFAQVTTLYFARVSGDTVGLGLDCRKRILAWGLTD